MPNYAPGTHITVTRGFPLRQISSSDPFGPGPATATNVQYERSHLGSVLEVVSADPPFLAVRELVDGDGQPPLDRRVFSISLDEYRVKALSESYVQAMMEGERGDG